MKKGMRLFHLSTDGALTNLTPRRPRCTHRGELETPPCVAAAPEPLMCAALCTHHRSAQVLYVYEIHPDDVQHFSRVHVSWDSDKEYRAYVPVRVVRTGETMSGGNCVRPCNCGSGYPWPMCGRTDYCG